MVLFDSGKSHGQEQTQSTTRFAPSSLLANAMEQPQSTSDKAQHRACDPCSNALSLFLSLSLSLSLSLPIPLAAPGLPT
ncbi:uncharacterized protein LY79DRAFT_573463 [Colletotrichum navitas]|uniref:Uncharacterized protein n=1 Tax=Colletotrichum navitas TaxID=681940 RepID=A0AAD8PJ57_9PEZI|nr:uncharacterized protein LY79DRAFT_573463 [Colletotrichum navitas]KAK1564202.1 hypothetical protein LY79DRAFT_573463 [Colletotrichum navitas]